MVNEQYDAPITQEQVRQIKLRFDSLTEKDKADAYILFYTESSSTYTPYITDKTKAWIPVPRKILEELFQTRGYL